MDMKKAETVEFELEFSVPQADLFYRSQPAGTECPQEYWSIARQLIDYGSALLISRNTLAAADERMRDLVKAALLRRALVTTEAIVVDLYRGLAEPVTALSRVLLEIELNTKLVTQDTTTRMAKLLAGHHYLSGQRHGQNILSDKDSREGIAERDPDHLEWLKGVARSLARDFESPAFDEVREEVKAGGSWHGMRQEEAFRFVGASHDYFSSYNLGTFFVHTSNIDFDFVDHPDGPKLRALVDRDPNRIRSLLAMTLHRLLSIMKMFVGNEPEVEVEGGNKLVVDALTGFSQVLIDVFKPRVGPHDLGKERVVPTVVTTPLMMV